MILKTTIIAVTLCLCWIEGIFGTSYSNVYFQQNTQPGSFLEYGAPPVSYGSQVARLAAPPVGSVVPLPQTSSFVAPCTVPCIYPGQPVAPTENARIASYNSPNVPVVVASSNDIPTNYEYSYVVYDDSTGDQKAQREQSDGGVVRGQYAFLQPDGYVREVQYTADDLRGFNAVVRNFLPNDGGIIFEVKGNNKELPPCDDGNKKDPLENPKSEALKVGEKPNSTEEPKREEVPTSEEKKSEVKSKSEDVPNSENMPKSEDVPTSEEKLKSGDVPKSEDVPKSTETPNNEVKSSSGEKSKSEGEPMSNEKSQSDKGPIEDSTSKEKPEKTEDGPKSKEPEGKVNEPKPEGHSGETSEEHASHARPTPSESKEVSTQIVGTTSNENFPGQNDIIHCIQEAMKKGKIGNSASPLTFIVVPSNPC